MPERTGPHGFQALAWWDRLRTTTGRCRHCHAPQALHPIQGWITSRPVGDKSAAVFSTEALTRGAPKDECPKCQAPLQYDPIFGYVTCTLGGAKHFWRWWPTKGDE